MKMLDTGMGGYNRFSVGDQVTLIASSSGLEIVSAYG